MIKTFLFCVLAFVVFSFVYFPQYAIIASIIGVIALIASKFPKIIIVIVIGTAVYSAFQVIAFYVH